MGTIQLNERIDVDCPAGALWAVVADYERDPEWRTDVVTMAPRPGGIVMDGTTTAEVLRFAGRTWHNDGEVVSVSPGRRFEWRTTRGADANGARSVEPLPDGRSRVQLSMEVRTHGFERLLTPLTRRMLRRTLAADLRRLRELVVDAKTEGFVSARSDLSEKPKSWTK
jgi:uncharacterized membrane protein